MPSIVSNRDSIRARCALLIGAILLTFGCAITTGGVVKEGTTLTPLAGVTVAVVRAQDTTHVVDSTRSGALGDFTLHAPAPGAFRLRFSLPPHLRILRQVDTLRNGSRINRDYPLDVLASLRTFVFFDFEVDKPVVVRDGSVFPAYPEALRLRAIEGEVLLQFVVGLDGRVEDGSARVVRSTDASFTVAVLAGLSGLQFAPATVAGITVRQLVQQPFVFRLSRDQGALKRRVDTLRTAAGLTTPGV
jgi:TonB family protein